MVPLLPAGSGIGITMDDGKQLFYAPELCSVPAVFDCNGVDCGYGMKLYAIQASCEMLYENTGCKPDYLAVETGRIVMNGFFGKKAKEFCLVPIEDVTGNVSGITNTKSDFKLAFEKERLGRYRKFLL